MIDWLFVGLSAMWIVGLSLGLVTVSIAFYQASEEKRRLGQVLSRNGFRLAIDLGMLLFFAGLAGLAAAWWQKLVWGLLVMGFVVSVWMDGRNLIGKTVQNTKECQ